MYLIKKRLPIPFFSIITIVRNGEKYLEQAIQSVVLNQTYKNFEYLIIDGKSTDNTVAIIKKYESYIDVFISAEDDGISHAFNKGIRLCRGKYIGIANADDWLEGNALEIMEKEISKKSIDVDLICGSVNIWENDKRIITVPSNPKTIIQESTIQHAATFINKNAFLKYGYFDKSYKLAMDYELFLRMKMQGASMIAINKIVANRRLEGISYINYYQSLQEVKKARRQYFSTTNVNFIHAYSLAKGSIGQSIKKNRLLSWFYILYWTMKK